MDVVEVELGCRTIEGLFASPVEQGDILENFGPQSPVANLPLNASSITACKKLLAQLVGSSAAVLPNMPHLQPSGKIRRRQMSR